MNRFRGDRLPPDLRPLTPEERKRAAIPARFRTRQEHRDFMREYMRRRRARLTGERPNPPRLVAAVAVRRHDREGFCGLCGHASPEPTCPVCVVELSGGHVFERSTAWGVMLSAATE